MNNIVDRDHVADIDRIDALQAHVQDLEIRVDRWVLACGGLCTIACILTLAAFVLLVARG